MTATDTQQTEPMTATTTWMRLARAAAITMVVWAILLHLMARTAIPPVIVIGMVFLGFAPFLAGERRKLGLVYAVVSALMMLGNAPVIIDELIHIGSAPSFVLTLLSTIGAITAIVAGLGSFFGWSVGAIRPLVTGAVGVFVVGALTSVMMFAATENAVALDSDVRVIAEQVVYQPGNITLGAGASGIWIENKDGIYHTFTVEEIGVDLEIPGLKSARVDIDAIPGAYTYQCTVPGHENMTGMLTIEG